jgi:hypothetical protein
MTGRGVSNASPKKSKSGALLLVALLAERDKQVRHFADRPAEDLLPA